MTAVTTIERGLTRGIERSVERPSARVASVRRERESRGMYHRISARHELRRPALLKDSTKGVAVGPTHWRGVIQSATLTYLALLITVTHLPLDYVVTEDFHQQARIYWMDKLINGALFAVLTVLVLACVPPIKLDKSTGDLIIFPGRLTMLCASVILIAFLNEITQPYFGRRCEAWDLVAASASIIPGASCFLLLKLLSQALDRIRV